ncbi:threonine aldolase [Flavobacterium psychrophilum]|uniref:Threonine aldolase n=2 Tax=Flavobacterium psychrophilum TaxID=96345 RepID=A6GY01_FLAPJ|nr:GntG family PLP-dependent aldolase [Flavobacterium psychrophilum]AIG29700.1 threonine aldolase [Flavobacterium psychrophilum]AIG31977.1 threonine aldolase [Flavobacterium psychrophilum]AIG34132.1 threonine aldolase [Flavobacterium psychrophilum]AIG36495.1 threonine aldolase [Flavobacterium psychrophilum]AIG38760.1 threonine aldolase [Flavobacterium psychrophilum]
MEINLVSDTVTKPTQEMLGVMFGAKVGDDVYKQDPTVVALEWKIAKMFGMQAALFFPSGTMANQTAIKLHTNPGDQIICDKWSHIYHYEGGGASFNSGVSCSLVDGNRGMITANLVKNAINDPDFYHAPLTSLVSIENTTNKGGGACYDLEPLREIKQVCADHNLKYHLDGARLWNALVAKRQSPSQFGELFDTISVCLSKGLGAPIGSVLVSDAKTIARALRIRKIFGGGMRQAGYLAAAGIYALDNHIERLADDHRRAREIAQVLQSLPWIAHIEPVETNIIIFSIQTYLDEKVIIEKLREKGISISSMGYGKMRIVTHLDYREVMHGYVLETFFRLKV